MVLIEAASWDTSSHQNLSEKLAIVNSQHQ
jgi:hypothetical protein